MQLIQPFSELKGHSDLFKNNNNACISTVFPAKIITITCPLGHLALRLFLLCTLRPVEPVSSKASGSRTVISIQICSKTTIMCAHDPSMMFSATIIILTRFLGQPLHPSTLPLCTPRRVDTGGRRGPSAAPNFMNLQICPNPLKNNKNTCIQSFHDVFCRNDHIRLLPWSTCP